MSQYDDECDWENKFFVSQDILTAISVFGVLVGIFGAFSNSVVLTAIYKKPALRSSQVLFIGSLAMADLSVGLVTMPIYTSGALTWPLLLKNNLFEMVLDFLVFQTLSASTFSLCAVSFDRFVVITSPLNYETVITKRRSYWAICLVWLFSTVIGCSSFMVTDYSSRPAIYIAVVLVAFIIPFLLIAYFYSKIFQIARRQAKQIAGQPNINSAERSDQTQTFKRQHKAAMTIALVIGTFAICWIPNVIISVIHYSVSRESKCEAEKIEQFWLITLPFAFINSAVNPIIYAVRNKDFRKAFKELIFCLADV